MIAAMNDQTRPARLEPVTHGRVWRLAGPIILSNSTVPLLGAVDTAVVGHLPAAYYLGAVAVGAMIFTIIYWAFGFLRMGTTGFTAQAFGADDGDEVRANLGRALLLAVVFGLASILFQDVIAAVAFGLIEASADVERLAREYLAIRIWGAPAALANFALMGWFIGIRNTKAVLILQIATNGINIVLTLLFVIGFGWGVPGVALGTLIAEYGGVAIGLALVPGNLKAVGGHFQWARIVLLERLRRMLAVNFDIFVRTMCVLMAFAIFKARGAAAGDEILAANAVLLNFISFLAFGLDGFAFAVEALVGGAVGARDRRALREAVRMTTLWALICALAYAAVYAGLGYLLINVLTGVPEVRALAETYQWWIIAMPLIAVWGYQLDGIFIGATRSADMRNMMLLSFGVFLAALYAFEPLLGNHGLWLALTAFMTARAATLAARYPALERSIGS